MTRNNDVIKGRHRIDDGSNARANQSARGSGRLPIEIIRYNFNCKFCGHHKAFRKSAGKECCSCKKIQ